MKKTSNAPKDHDRNDDDVCRDGCSQKYRRCVRIHSEHHGNSRKRRPARHAQSRQAERRRRRLPPARPGWQRPPERRCRDRSVLLWRGSDFVSAQGTERVARDCEAVKCVLYLPARPGRPRLPRPHLLPRPRLRRSQTPGSTGLHELGRRHLLRDRPERSDPVLHQSQLRADERLRAGLAVPADDYLRRPGSAQPRAEVLVPGPIRRARR